MLVAQPAVVPLPCYFCCRLCMSLQADLRSYADLEAIFSKEK